MQHAAREVRFNSSEPSERTLEKQHSVSVFIS